ncbi:energy-coupling factor transporter transmembrane protein EcfT [Neobacillus piezotolerans]|uniref:Energy-coupling factor transporter transmembrane protein EcfT n=1 Tax=Neobacillus piezotolerans TaxID=2259171 RepID=A0A3D8GRG0_9BACI|nr:energy-coupling factor transporter transmembrane component T [Neobacillus piezotolerans]RDU36861.1 energy-coupling factor transporter transmembrane protein EcfT [Neobacillus piezotolerans]
MNRLHPLTAFSYYAGALGMLLLFQHPAFLLVAFTLILFLNFVQDRFKSLRRWLFLILSSGVLLFGVNPVFNERGREILFELGSHRVTVEAVLLGGMAALSVMGMIALFVSYNEIMTPNKLLFLFSRIMPQFAVLLMLTLRFIPLMRIRLGEIAAVQASKGIAVASGTLRERAKNGMLYVQTLLVFSLEEAIQTADSMKARGYGSGTRSAYHHFRFRKLDWLSLCFLCAVFGFAVYGRLKGWGVLNVYPIMDSVSLSGPETVVLLAVISYIGFAAILELKGAFRWHTSN